MFIGYNKKEELRYFLCYDYDFSPSFVIVIYFDQYNLSEKYSWDHISLKNVTGAKYLNLLQNELPERLEDINLNLYL